MDAPSKNLSPKAVIFDLDDTLVDNNPRFQSILRSMLDFLQQETGQDLEQEVQQAIQQEPWIPAEKLLERIIPVSLENRDRILQAAIEHYYAFPFTEAELEHIKLFPGTLEVFSFLRQQGYQIILLSFGDLALQRKKLEQISEQHFDAIYLTTGNKVQVLQDIMAERKIDPKRSIIVGDKKHAEISAGNGLGFVTVQYLYGRHSGRPVREPGEQPQHTVSNMQELLQLLQKICH